MVRFLTESLSDRGIVHREKKNDQQQESAKYKWTTPPSERGKQKKGEEREWTLCDVENGVEDKLKDGQMVRRYGSCKTRKEKERSI